ncbi:MAG: right-handed parallel beta-helix repeat-containing protein [Planctomycetaceae bacterium]
MTDSEMQPNPALTIRFLCLTVALSSALTNLCADDRPSVELRIPQLKSLPDVTQTLQQQIDAGQGNLKLSGAEYFRITQPLVFNLAAHGAVSVTADEGVTLIMDGPGPAIRMVGTHNGTASPKTFEPQTWNQRMPLVSGLEILGAHPEADGIELQQTVEPTIRAVAVRECRHGIHLVTRNRNVIISDCHLYNNSGCGVFLDNVDLHQINVSGCHISYNREGGVVVRDGNVRNLQVSGCDIEGNMPPDETATTAANVLIDLTGSADDRTHSVAEVSITGCTIQHAANYSGSEDKTVAPGGANIRLAGKALYPIDSVTISGNVLSDTTTTIDLSHVLDVTVTANSFFAPKPNNLRVRDSRRVVVTGNTFNPRQFVRPGIVLFQNSHDCVISACTFHALATETGGLIIDGCSGMILTALNFSDCGSGIVIQNSTGVTISNCRATRTADNGLSLNVDAESTDVQLLGNSFGTQVRVSGSAVSGTNQSPAGREALQQ